jgi:hypothetical protein
MVITTIGGSKGYKRVKAFGKIQKPMPFNDMDWDYLSSTSAPASSRDF